MTKPSVGLEQSRSNYEELLEKMQHSMETSQAEEPDRLGSSLLGGIPYIGGLSNTYPHFAAFLAAHLVGPQDGPQGSCMLWVNEEGLTVMAYIRDTELKAFFNGDSLEACLEAAEAFLSQSPIPWRATKKARKAAAKKPKQGSGKPH